MSDAYDFRPGGSLKLKGGVAEGGVKKKKKKSKPKAETDERAKEILREEIAAASSSSRPGSGSNSPGPSATTNDRKTDAERRFEQVQRRRLEQRVAKVAAKSHKDRVSEFNAHLESLSEHHDIPKVGPG
ncbi:hypothetical protein MKEN_01281300 [Mycena kentingensis (nom. inval.)]|nr:hypothetical protein MKEN_01281300 [Mycena kentingensis (nom. inval.)]